MGKLKSHQQVNSSICQHFKMNQVQMISVIYSFILYCGLGSVNCSDLKLSHSSSSSNINSVSSTTSRFECPDEFGYYPHPTECDKYFVCVFGGSLMESCTGGLMYSHELQTCDWPRNVQKTGSGNCPQPSSNESNSSISSSGSSTGSEEKVVKIGERGELGLKNVQGQDSSSSSSSSGDSDSFGKEEQEQKIQLNKIRAPLGRRRQNSNSLQQGVGANLNNNSSIGGNSNAEIYNHDSIKNLGGVAVESRDNFNSIKNTRRSRLHNQNIHQNQNQNAGQQRRKANPGEVEDNSEASRNAAIEEDENTRQGRSYEGSIPNLLVNNNNNRYSNNNNNGDLLINLEHLFTFNKQPQSNGNFEAFNKGPDSTPLTTRLRRSTTITTTSSTGTMRTYRTGRANGQGNFRIFINNNNNLMNNKSFNLDDHESIGSDAGDKHDQLSEDSRPRKYYSHPADADSAEAPQEHLLNSRENRNIYLPNYYRHRPSVYDLNRNPNDNSYTTDTTGSSDNSNNPNHKNKFKLKLFVFNNDQINQQIHDHREQPSPHHRLTPHPRRPHPNNKDHDHNYETDKHNYYNYNNNNHNIDIYNRNKPNQDKRQYNNNYNLYERYKTPPSAQPNVEDDRKSGIYYFVRNNENPQYLPGRNEAAQNQQIRHQQQPSEATKQQQFLIDEADRYAPYHPQTVQQMQLPVSLYNPNSHYPANISRSPNNQPIILISPTTGIRQPSPTPELAHESIKTNVNHAGHGPAKASEDFYYYYDDDIEEQSPPTAGPGPTAGQTSPGVRHRITTPVHAPTPSSRPYVPIQHHVLSTAQPPSQQGNYYVNSSEYYYDDEDESDYEEHNPNEITRIQLNPITTTSQPPPIVTTPKYSTIASTSKKPFIYYYSTPSPSPAKQPTPIPPRRRNPSSNGLSTNKLNKLKISQSQSKPRDVYAERPLPSRPLHSSVYDSNFPPPPQVGSTATKCKKNVNCFLPDCFCGGGKDIPADLKPEQIPQMVLLTFDDSVNDLNKGLYRDLFEKGNRKNPNGCPISATFYVSHEWTDYSQVQNLAADGHEIASHSVSHSFGEKFSEKKWEKEINGQREILAAYGGVKLADVRGMRAPFLAIGGNNMFKMLYDANYTYDSSMPVYENRPPSYPYTLDYKLFHDCMIPPCPTKSFPGVWEVPMTMWIDLKGGRCSMGDACSNPPDAEGVYQMLVKNFERHYTTNRAPFGLFYHAAWFTQAHHKEGFEAFLDSLVAMDDVYLVTNWQAIQWMRNPTPLDRILTFPPWSTCYDQQSNNNDYYRDGSENIQKVKKCPNHKVCNLWHKEGVRYLKSCQPCPERYPWTGSTGVSNPFKN